MVDLDDIQGFGDQLENELSKLDAHHDADRRWVKRWVQKVDGNVTDSTLSQYLKELRQAGKALDTPITELSEADMDSFVYDLRHNANGGSGYSDGTVRNREFAVRKLLRDLGDEIEADVSWAEDYDLTKPPDNKVKPEDMLRAEDINALTDGAQNMRDIALIEFLADTGARLSMMASLRVSDVDLNGDRATFTPNPNAAGLKGAAIREYPIIDSAAILRTYLRNTHPRPDVDDVAFFHKLPGHGYSLDDPDDGGMSPSLIRKQLRRAADAGDVDRPVNPHNFRHSAISRMAREGYTRSEVEHRVAWEVDTDMWATYEHISAEEHNEAIFEKAGVVDSDDSETPERRPCGNCTEPVAPHHDFCPHCSAPVSKRARDMQESATSSLANGMVEVEDMSRREFRAAVLQHLQADPSDLGTHEEPPSSDSSSE